jgi:hypothetical protein
VTSAGHEGNKTMDLGGNILRATIPGAGFSAPPSMISLTASRTLKCPIYSPRLVCIAGSESGYSGTSSRYNCRSVPCSKRCTVRVRNKLCGGKLLSSAAEGVIDCGSIICPSCSKLSIALLRSSVFVAFRVKFSEGSLRIAATGTVSANLLAIFRDK